MLTTIVIIILFAAIIYNLGAGLYFMMTDKGKSDRTVKALTRRIGLSVLLIALVIVGIWAGLIKPHGIGQ
jgi:succinate dehydrogenase/fumarate reductase cytochrome b subunit